MSNPIYVEKWKVSGNSNGDILTITYSDSMCPTYSHLLALRDNMAEMYDCRLEYLITTYAIVKEGAEDNE